ncbi:MAG: hypothetical protein LH624_05440, partial [Cryobacterium sp.]|nr:hypothetical protein [Cryobacterium sp.]
MARADTTTRRRESAPEPGGTVGPLRRSARMRLVLSFFLLLLFGCAAALVAVRGILLADLVTRVEIALNQEIDDFNRLRDSVDSD